MQYPAMNRSRQYRVSVPELDGGVNYAVPAHMIADNQLSEVKNMWYRNGRLQTRPSLNGKRAFHKESGFEYRYSSVGKYGVAVGEGDTGGCVNLIQENGSLETYAYTRDTNVHIFVAADSYGIDDEGNYVDDGNTDKNHDVIAFIQGDSGCGVYGVDKDSKSFVPLKPYVPNVLKNCRPVENGFVRAVNGDQLDPYNMLTDEYTCTFTPDGVGMYYYLPFENCAKYSDEAELEVEVVGRNRDNPKDPFTHKARIRDEKTGLYYEGKGTVDGFSLVFDKELGCFWFVCDPDFPSAEIDLNAAMAVSASDNGNIITARSRRSDEEFKKSQRTIFGMEFSTWFGGMASGLAGGTRLFVSGNPEYPSLVHWSSLNNPLYFPENNYAYVGEKDTAVTAFGKQSDMLVIFKKNELYFTTYVQGETVTAEQVEEQTVIDIEAAAAKFPMMPIHPEIGCDCPATIQLCNNRLVWLNSDGNVYGLFSNGVYNERNVRRLSLQLGYRLQNLGKSVLRKASATRYEDHYVLLIDDSTADDSTAYVMDFSSYGFNYYGSYGSDEKAQAAVSWYKWEFPTKLSALLYVRDSAVVLAGEYPNHIGALVFKNGGTVDQTVNAAGAFTDQNLEYEFRTKQFDFGHAERLKRVNSMYLQMSGKQGNNAFLTYYNADNKYVNAETLVLPDYELVLTAPFRLSPNVVRARLFGFGVSGTGHVEVGEVVLNYNTMGELR